MRDRSALVGAIVVLLAWAGPAVAAQSPDGTRYRWVDPPADQALVNVPPLAREADLAVSPTGRLPAADVWTGDLQAMLSLPDLELAAVEGDAIAVAINPRAAGELAPLPSGMTADGNAYEVALRFGGVDVGWLSRPGRLFLAVPERATAMLFSPDGAAWEVVDLELGTAAQAVASFERPGFYLAVAPIAADSTPETGASPAAGPSGGRTAALAVAVAGVTVGGLWVVRRRA